MKIQTIKFFLAGMLGIVIAEVAIDSIKSFRPYKENATVSCLGYKDIRAQFLNSEGGSYRVKILDGDKPKILHIASGVCTIVED